MANWDKLSDKARLKIIQSEYVDNQRSFPDIANEVGTYGKKLSRFAKKHGFKIRSASDAQKLALSSGRGKHPTQGRERTFEEKSKISKTQIGNWENLSEEDKEKIRQQAIDHLESMTEEDRKIAAERAREGILKAAKQGSKLEKFLKKELTKLGYVVEYHRTDLIPTKTRVEVDLFIPTHSLCIEIDGVFHTQQVFNDYLMGHIQFADTKKSAAITGAGYYLARMIIMSKLKSFDSMKRLLDKVVDAIKMVEHGNLETCRYIEIEV